MSPPPVPAGHATAGAGLIRLYPRAWQERYGDELAAILDSEPPGLRARLDLVRSALDAHLHPALPSPLPMIAAVSASALASAHAIALAAQPVPTDWPGYIDEALPLIIGSVAALIPVIVALWLRLGDADGPLGRLGIVLAVTGHAAWLVALVAAATHVGYGPLTAAAATVAMVGTAALGVALVGHARVVLGTLLAAAGLAGIAPPGLGWPVFAAAWTGVAFALVVEFAGRSSAPRGPRLAA
jgi:hypothetical protein